MKLHYKVGDRTVDIDGVVVGLTRTEAEDLAHAAISIATGSETDHIHVSSADFQTEVTLYPHEE